MFFFFADDSSQKCAREGMEKVVAYGGILIHQDCLSELCERADEIAKNAGIPIGEEIKWSPRKNSWIYENLQGENRKACYNSLLELYKEYDCRCVITVIDPKLKNLKPEWAFERCVTYTLERVSAFVENNSTQAIVVSDKPSGGKKEDDQFLSDYLDHLESSNNFMLKGNFALNMLTASSHLVRHLQIADLITGITTAMVAGQTKYAEHYFDNIKAMLIQNTIGYIGGTGLKVYPDRLINLYHWVLGETHFSKASLGMAWPLPHSGIMFEENDGT